LAGIRIQLRKKSPRKREKDNYPRAPRSEETIRKVLKRAVLPFQKNTENILVRKGISELEKKNETVLPWNKANQEKKNRCHYLVKEKRGEAAGKKATESHGQARAGQRDGAQPLKEGALRRGS